MSDTYKGYELAEAVDNGLFSLEQRVNGASYSNCTIGYILKDVGNNFLFKDFEIIKEQEEIDIQNMEILDNTVYDHGNMTKVELDNYHNYTRTIVSQLVQAVKQLDKNIKEK